MSKIPTRYAELSQAEDLARFKAAGERMARRMEDDPEYKRQILQDIGYYEIMAQQAAEDAELANKAKTPQVTRRKVNSISDVGQAVPRSATSSKSRLAKRKSASIPQ